MTVWLLETIATPGAVMAVLVGVALATWNLYLTRRGQAPAARIAELERNVATVKAELKSCRRVNRWLREKNELTQAALLSLLPQADRLELLAAVGDRVPLDDETARWLDDDDEDK